MKMDRFCKKLQKQEKHAEMVKRVKEQQHFEEFVDSDHENVNKRELNSSDEELVKVATGYRHLQRLKRDKKKGRLYLVAKDENSKVAFDDDLEFKFKD